MSRCLSSMTGSTDAGPLQPQEDPVPLPVQPLTFERPVSEDSSLARRGHRRNQLRRKMTSTPPSGQTIQLTPLWEHVVRRDVDSVLFKILNFLILYKSLCTFFSEMLERIIWNIVSELYSNILQMWSLNWFICNHKERQLATR